MQCITYIHTYMHTHRHTYKLHAHLLRHAFTYIFTCTITYSAHILTHMFIHAYKYFLPTIYIHSYMGVTHVLHTYLHTIYIHTYFTQISKYMFTYLHTFYIHTFMTNYIQLNTYTLTYVFLFSHLTYWFLSAQCSHCVPWLRPSGAALPGKRKMLLAAWEALTWASPLACPA